METESCSCKDIIDRHSVDYAIKAAALKASPSVVSVITHDIPEEMAELGVGKGTYIFHGSGIIIQSDDTRDEDASYSSTVLCPAYLFKRTSSVQPDQIKVDVRGSGSKLYKAELIACDFHFNIAALRIKSDSPLCPATLCNMSDLPSLDAKETNQRRSFRVHSGTKILIAKRSWVDPFQIIAYTGALSTHDRSHWRCKELFSIKYPQPKERKGGGAIINYHGEVVGLFYRDGSVSPVNLILRWWDHYKRFREFHRPCLGVNVANLHEAHTTFMNKFNRKFPNIVTGVVVTEVEKDSPAHLAEIECDDVILKYNGHLIRSKLELFELVWDYAGQVVELDVLKASNGGRLKLSMTIGEIAPHKLHEWGLPDLYCLSAVRKAGAYSAPLRISRPVVV